MRTQTARSGAVLHRGGPAPDLAVIRAILIRISSAGAVDALVPPRLVVAARPARFGAVVLHPRVTAPILRLVLTDPSARDEGVLLVIVPLLVVLTRRADGDAGRVAETARLGAVRRGRGEFGASRAGLLPDPVAPPRLALEVQAVAVLARSAA